ncbi:site-specific integrase [Noviherbaspirillum sp.]|uniref:site-specific integrase n=1 Tax=Noviherbaspirillum sp. TaxID=1926288 RepID=UPI002FE2738F
MDNRLTPLTNVFSSDNVHLSLPNSVEVEEQMRLANREDFCNQLQSVAHLSEGHRLVFEFVVAALADNTRLAYRGDLADFMAWGGEVPCTPEQLATYIACRSKIHSVYTIARRVIGISRAHTSQGIADPAKNDLVRAVLRGMRRKNGTPQRQSVPLLKSDIISILPLMFGAKGIRDRALVLLGFAAALRRSELVALDVSDIQFVKEGLILHIRRGKTDQVSKGRKIAVPYGRTCACPVRAVEHWLTLAKLVDGPLFRRVTKGSKIGAVRLTAQSVALIVKGYAAAIGLNAASISGHSLRAGLVTSAAMAGVPIWKIKAQSGHASDTMVSRYVRDASLFDGNAAGAVL